MTLEKWSIKLTSVKAQDTVTILETTGMSTIPQATQEKKFSWLQEVSSTPGLLSRIQV